MGSWIGGAVAVGMVVAGLAFMIGMYWVLEVLPVAAFVAVLIAYAVLSGRPVPSRRDPPR
jgi:hypothetical protein